MTWYRLKILRVVVSVTILIGLTLALLGGTSSFLAKVGSWLAAIQLVPSVLSLFAGSFISLAALLILIVTLLAGRVYCSTICPLGALQDVIARVRSLLDKKHKPLAYAKPVPRIRAAVLVLVVAGVISGWTSVVLSFLDPYSNFGRIVSELIRPLFYQVFRIVPGWAKSQTDAGVHPAAVHWAGFGALLVPLVVLGALIWLAATRGRLYCNTICPVGALLGQVSRHAAFRLQLDADCRKCNKCARACKAQCIDTRTGVIDNSRCVSCLSCIPVCAGGYVGYRFRWKLHGRKNLVSSTPLVTQIEARAMESVIAPDHRRRAVFTAGALALVGAVGGESLWAGSAKDSDLSGELAGSTKSTSSASESRLVRPPGSASLEQYLDRCTACNLCISACPTQALQPSSLQAGLSGLMKPRMDYAGSFCDYDCNRCGHVCPGGALAALTLADKRRTRIGLAKLDASRCVVQSKGIACTLCIDKCPAKAIDSVPYREHLRLPHVKALQCIGCGRCEHECPVPDRKAITIFGLLRETHVPVDTQHENAGALAHTERIGF